MPQEANAVPQDKPAPKPKTVEVTVQFALTTKPPFKAEFARTETVGAVRTKAMNYFGVHDEPNAEYYLTDKHDSQVDNNSTLDSIVEDEKKVKFKLSKRTVSG